MRALDLHSYLKSEGEKGKYTDDFQVSWESTEWQVGLLAQPDVV